MRVGPLITIPESQGRLAGLIEAEAVVPSDRVGLNRFLAGMTV
jgi:hypothetical protein